MLTQAVIGALQPIDGVQVGIDKTTLGIPMKKDKQGIQIVYGLQNEILHSEHSPQIKIIKKKAHTAVAGHYFDEAGTNPILTMIAGFIWGTPYASLMVNPSRMNHAGWIRVNVG